MFIQIKIVEVVCYRPFVITIIQLYTFAADVCNNIIVSIDSHAIYRVHHLVLLVKILTLLLLETGRNNNEKSCYKNLPIYK